MINRPCEDLASAMEKLTSASGLISWGYKTYYEYVHSALQHEEYCSECYIDMPGAGAEVLAEYLVVNPEDLAFGHFGSRYFGHGWESLEEFCRNRQRKIAGTEMAMAEEALEDIGLVPDLDRLRIDFDHHFFEDFVFTDRTGAVFASIDPDDDYDE